jgi:hypothetical protein
MRVSAIACGYEDANDLDRLRHDPLKKLAVARCPQSGGALASQSTICRLEALIDQFGTTVRLTFWAAHGGQQLAFWNAHHYERGFAPMYIYHVASGTPVVAILRPARTAKVPGLNGLDAASYSNTAYPHPPLSANLALSFTIKSTSCRVPGRVAAGNVSIFFGFQWTFRGATALGLEGLGPKKILDEHEKVARLVDNVIGERRRRAVFGDRDRLQIVQPPGECIGNALQPDLPFIESRL